MKNNPALKFINDLKLLLVNYEGSDKVLTEAFADVGIHFTQIDEDEWKVKFDNKLSTSKKILTEEIEKSL